MTNEFDDYEIQEGCTVQPETKEQLIEIIKQAISECGNSVDLNFIDTSKITDMSRLFAGSNRHNGYVGYGFGNFNGDISNWNTSNVTDMSMMFFDSNYFNQPLNNWNISNVKYMECMFSYAKNFNQDLSNWTVPIESDDDLALMFNDCPIDNKHLPKAVCNVIFVEAAIDDPVLLKTSGNYKKIDRIWKVPKQDFNNDNLELINKLCYKSFDDVLACTPMSKLELAQLMLTNQNELSKKQQIDNKQLSSKNRSL